jgi:hypothetical protein
MALISIKSNNWQAVYCLQLGSRPGLQRLPLRHHTDNKKVFLSQRNKGGSGAHREAKILALRAVFDSAPREAPCFPSP